MALHNVFILALAQVSFPKFKGNTDKTYGHSKLKNNVIRMFLLAFNKNVFFIMALKAV